MAVQYANFDLLIERSGEGFKARVLDSPAGEAISQFQLPYTQDDVENFFVQIGHTRLIETSQMQKMRVFGQQLFEATFTGNVRDKFRESLIESNRNREGLRIRLRISDVPELANLPWEFMYDASLSRFLTLSIETPLVRYLDVPRDIQPLTIHPPLQILAVISSPRNFPTLNVEHEWNNLKEALNRLENRGLVKLTKTEKPTLQALQRQLRRGEYHIFHFIGHGMFSKINQDGLLLFEDEIKGGDPVSSRDLGILLHDHRHLRLAVLNACEGARTSMEDQFSGTAQSLMLQGLPAVIAMQFRITDIAAITMAREFYAALADGYPVDAALTEARKAIKTQDNELEWGTPVLYMRSPDGAIFDVKALPSRLQEAQQISALDRGTERALSNLYTEGLEAFYLKEWEKAILKFQAVIDSQPDYKDVTTKLDIAQNRLKLHLLDEQAKAAEEEGNWEAAIKALEILSKEFPEQGPFLQRLTKIQTKRQLSTLYEEARQLAKAEKWSTVIHVFDEIHAKDPQYSDPEGLLEIAEDAIAGQRLQDELQALYQEALQAIDDKNWLIAQNHLHQIQKKQEGYRETERLLQTAKNEIERIEKQKEERDKLASLYVQAENLAHRKQWQKALEKIEEIQKIQPDFEDPKHVAARISTELEKSRQEEEKQSKLAELYAEAVNLNRDGNYQQALEKWNQIRVIDTTYPDRQKVQATARKMLNHLAKPREQFERWTWTPRFRHGWWIFIIGFLLAGIRYLSILITQNHYINWSIFGLITGAVILYVVRLLHIRMSLPKMIFLGGGWLVSSLAIPLSVSFLSETYLGFGIGYTLAGALYGLTLFLVLSDIQLRPKLSTLILSFAFGMFAGNSAGLWFSELAGFNNDAAEAFALLTATLIAGHFAFGKAIANDKEKSLPSREETIFSLAGILILARWLASISGLYIERAFLNPFDIHWDSATLLILIFYFVLFGVFSAWFLARFLNAKLASPLSKKEVIYLTAFWIIGMIATSFVCFLLGLELENEWGWRIGWLTGGIIVGFGMWLSTSKFTVRNKSVYLITSVLGWGGGFLLSEHILGELGELFTRIAGDPLGFNIASNSNIGFAGLIGGLIMLNQLTGDQNNRVNWKTVLSAILGFALGNAVVNIIYQEYDYIPFGQLFIMGLMGGASLAVPSKDYKRYLIIGALGGIGRYFGYQAYLAADEQFYLLYVGGIFGLSIGLATKRITRTLTIALISIIAFSIGGIANPILLEWFDYPSWGIVFFALSSGIAGFIIGSTWSFLNSTN